jgi:hypothetical protein
MQGENQFLSPIPHRNLFLTDSARELGPSNCPKLQALVLCHATWSNNAGVCYQLYWGNSSLKWRATQATLNGGVPAMSGLLPGRPHYLFSVLSVPFHCLGGVRQQSACQDVTDPAFSCRHPPPSPQFAMCRMVMRKSTTSLSSGPVSPSVGAGAVFLYCQRQFLWEVTRNPFNKS